MTYSNSNNKLIRYFFKPNFLSSVFSSLFGSSTDALNHCLALSPLYTFFDSHTICKNPPFHNSSPGSPFCYSVTQRGDYFCLSNNRDNPSYKYTVCCSISLLRPHWRNFFRWFSVFSSDGCLGKTSVGTVVSHKKKGFESMGIACFDKSKLKVRAVDGFECQKQVSEIVEVIRSSKNDLKLKLDSMDLNLSVKSVSEIFRVLNSERISALDFFHWVWHMNPIFYSNSEICSLIIANCGWLDDNGTMISLLKEFSSKQICLNEKAFGFLPVLVSSKASVLESIIRLMDMLNGVGGSSRGSGICALIKMLCALDSFEIAKFVIEIARGKASYYNILIRERCRSGQFEEAHGLIKEMREVGCDPNAKTYNYLLSYLCKFNRTGEAWSVLEEMIEKGSPDALTFEIFIYFACRLGKVDGAHQFFDRMVSRGLEPRLSTYAAFVKGYFYVGRYEEAHKYVICTSGKYEQSTNVIYSLLASLHQKKGDLLVAFDIIIELMEKGLKPNFPVYRRTMKGLQKAGRKNLAGDLKSRFFNFRLESSKATG